jgi:hypothetical protein
MSAVHDRPVQRKIADAQQKYDQNRHGRLTIGKGSCAVITGMPLVELDWPFVARLGGLSACAADRSSLRRGEAAKSLAE